MFDNISSEKLKTDCLLLKNRAEQMEDKDTLSAAEKSILKEIHGLVREYSNELDKREPPRPLTVQGPNAHLSDAGRSTFSPAPGRNELRAPGTPRDYKALFGTGGHQWADKTTDFFSAVFSNRHHPGLIQNAMSETMPSDGGFLVPQQTASQIHNVSLENELVLPRCFVQPMTSNECKIPAMSIGDHSTALMGGFTASYRGEADTISEHSPKARGMVLNAKKLTGLIRFSSELAQDAVGGEKRIIDLCGQGLGWYRDKAFLKGSGSGEPLGILNAPCLVTVAPKSGQSSAPIIYGNLTEMMSRMFSGSFKNSVWVCHQTTIPSLLELSVAIGTGGDHIPVMTEGPNGEFKILTRPVIFTEKTEPLGTKGDIMLCDFTQYVVGLRGEMRFDQSIHAHFTTDEILARLIERHDGQPLWDTALTLEDGTTTVSPFVTLGSR